MLASLAVNFATGRIIEKKPILMTTVKMLVPWDHPVFRQKLTFMATERTPMRAPITVLSTEFQIVQKTPKKVETVIRIIMTLKNKLV